MPKDHPVVEALRKTSEGLLFISESEAELEPFLWSDGGELNEDTLPQRLGTEEGTPVETTTLDKFFRAVSKEDKPAFDRLAGVLHQHLSNLRVFKVGETEKEVYIVGKTTDGVWAGLKTTVVET
jgi:hypothetical protein